MKATPVYNIRKFAFLSHKGKKQFNINVTDAKENGYYTFPNVTANHTISVTFRASNTTGITENRSQQDISIYPNPTKDEIFIKSDLQIGKVEIFSLTGIILMTENNFTGKISVSALPQGVYLLKVYTDKGLVVNKILKE